MTTDGFIGWTWSVVGVDLGRAFGDRLMPTMAFRAERDPCSLGKPGGRWMVVDDFGAVQRFRQFSAARRRQRAIQREGGKVYVRRWTRSRVAYYTAFYRETL